jgi:glycosyltransferase involved in cell wall biosynthesis
MGGRKRQIAIDARALEGPRKGIGRYLFSLLDNMQLPVMWQITLIFHHEIPQVLPRGNYQTQLNAAPHTYLWEQVALPCWLSRHRPDLFLAPANIVPLWLPCPTVLILHDTMMFVPALSLSDAQRYYTYQTWVLQLTASRCQSIITVSDFSAREIVKELGTNLAPKVKAIPEGVEERFFTEPAPGVLDAFLARHGLKPGYILHFASAVPRKNTRAVLQALADLKSQGIKLPQVFLPGLVSHDSAVQGWLREYGVEAITAGYLSEEELPLAYAGAGLLIYPTLWEGFGLPLLEGMATGLPVVAVDGTSIPELAGGCAWLMRRGRAAEIADYIRRWVENPAAGRELGLQAKQRAKQFKWEETAKGVLKVLEETIKIS